MRRLRGSWPGVILGFPRDCLMAGSGLSWARLGSPGLSKAVLSSTGLPGLSCAFLGSPGLYLGYRRVAGRHSDAGRHTSGSLAAIVMLGAIP